jgi:hypothetical protein
MRSIQLVLRNLLVFFAVLVLFANVGRAQDAVTTNGQKYNKCESDAVAATDKSAELDAESLGIAYVSGKKYKTKSTGVGTAEDIREFSANQSTAAGARAAAHETNHKACVSACSVTLSNDPQLSSDMSMNDAEDKINKILKTKCAWIAQAAIAANENKVVSSLASFEASRAKKSLLTKVAIGGAAVGGGLLLMDHLDDKKDKKKEAKAAEEKERAENGIIKDADGKDLLCFSEQNYLRVECSETMLGLCQAGKSTTAGCRAFNSNYCASSGSGTNYCLYADSRTYCSQSGSMIASSPACTWSASRSDECKKNPEQVSCLYSGSAESLTLACANYPSDPLCAANSAGRIVVQGGVAPTPNIDTAAADTNASAAQDYGDGASVTMSSVIGKGTTSTTSNSRGTADISSSTLASTESMFTSSSSVAAKACADGLLQNCSN